MVRREFIPYPHSHFVKVLCPDCENEQVVFTKASTKVLCQVCGATLVEPTGGKAKILGKIVQVLDEDRVKNPLER